jgi:hypothetical protein
MWLVACLRVCPMPLELSTPWTVSPFANRLHAREAFQEVSMRVAIAAIGFAGLACVFCCQNAGAVITSGTAIKEAAAVGSLATQTRLYWRGYRKCYRHLVVGPYVCRRYWL